ncbi:MAG: hypothetical protein EXR77_03560 [Myxococcales bacterium]|nr:hypothetical protein [Myxococcales bacterium]
MKYELNRPYGALACASGVYLAILAGCTTASAPNPTTIQDADQATATDATATFDSANPVEAVTAVDGPVNAAAPDIASQVADTAVQPLDTPRQALDTTAQALDTTAQALDTTAQELDTIGQELDTIGQELDTIGQELDTIGQELDTIGQALDTTAQELDTIGQELDTPAQAQDTPEPVEAPQFSAAQWTVLNTLSPLADVPPDPTNAYADNAKAAVLGQKLYFDASYSVSTFKPPTAGNIACSSCHAGEAMDQSTDKVNPTPYGTEPDTPEPRNALSVVNSAFYTWVNWGGRFDSQWALSLTVAENPNLFNSSRLAVAHVLFNKYQQDYDAVFPTPLNPALSNKAADAYRFPPAGKPKQAGQPDGAWEGMAAADREIATTIFVNYGKAIAAYMRLCVSRNAPFDKFMAGNKQALSPSAPNGLALFIGKANCVDCHSGPALSDGKFHALGVPSGFAKKVPDPGRFKDVPPLLASPFNSNGKYSDNTMTGKLAGLLSDPSQIGQFRTKSLRGVALSAPYFHAGDLTSLGASRNTPTLS